VRGHFHLEEIMKSAEEYIQARSRGLNHKDAMAILPDYAPLYVDRVPADVHATVQLRGWKVFPIFKGSCTRESHGLIEMATDDLEMIRRWARSRPEWAVATGQQSGMFAIEATGVQGSDSLLKLCKDDWGWLETLRMLNGSRRYIFFTWPVGLITKPQNCTLAAGLRVIANGKSVLLPTSRACGTIPFYFLNPQATVLPTPEWLLRLAFATSQAPAKPPLEAARAGSSLEAIQEQSA
jgi:hypothetical protein